MIYRQQGKKIILTDRGTNQQTLSTSSQQTRKESVKARKIYPEQSRRQRNLQHCTDKNDFKKGNKIQAQTEN